MKLRVVTLSLIVAIGIGSPAIASSTADEQQVNGRGARDRSGSNGGGESRGGDRRGGDGSGNAGGTRTASRADGGEQRGAARTGDRTATRTADRGAEPQRYAVPRDRDRDSYRDSGRIVVNRRPTNVNVSYGSSYRGPRYYTPVQYDRWARHYARWSPIGYAPWSLIYGSIGFSNFGVAFGSPYYAYAGYGNYGYGYGYPYAYAYGPGPYSPWQASGTTSEECD